MTSSKTLPDLHYDMMIRIVGFLSSFDLRNLVLTCRHFTQCQPAPKYSPIARRLEEFIGVDELDRRREYLEENRTDIEMRYLTMTNPMYKLLAPEELAVEDLEEFPWYDIISNEDGNHIVAVYESGDNIFIIQCWSYIEGVLERLAAVTIGPRSYENIKMENDDLHFVQYLVKPVVSVSHSGRLVSVLSEVQCHGVNGPRFVTLLFIWKMDNSRLTILRVIKLNERDLENAFELEQTQLKQSELRWRLTHAVQWIRDAGNADLLLVDSYFDYEYWHEKELFVVDPGAVNQPAVQQVIHVRHLRRYDLLPNEKANLSQPVVTVLDEHLPVFYNDFCVELGEVGMNGIQVYDQKHELLLRVGHSAAEDWLAEEIGRLLELCKEVSSQVMLGLADQFCMLDPDIQGKILNYLKKTLGALWYERIDNQRQDTLWQSLNEATKVGLFDSLKKNSQLRRRILVALDKDGCSRLFEYVDVDSQSFISAEIVGDKITRIIGGFNNSGEERFFNNSIGNPELRRKMLADLDDDSWNRLFERVDRTSQEFMLAQIGDERLTMMIGGLDDAARAQLFNESKWNPQLRCRMLAAIGEDGWSRLFDRVSRESRWFMSTQIDHEDITKIIGRLDDAAKRRIFDNSEDDPQRRCKILTILDDDDWSRLFGEVDGESRGLMFGHMDDEEITLMIKGLDDASRARIFENSDEDPQIRRKILAALDWDGWNWLFREVGGESRGFMLVESGDEVFARAIKRLDDATRVDIFNKSKWNRQLRCKMLAAIDGDGWNRLFEHVGGESRGFMLAHIDDDDFKRKTRGLTDAARVDIFNESKWNPQLRCRMLLAIDGDGWNRLFEHVGGESRGFMLAHIGNDEFTRMIKGFDDATRTEIFDKSKWNPQLRCRMLAAIDGDSWNRLFEHVSEENQAFMLGHIDDEDITRIIGGLDDATRGRIFDNSEDDPQLRRKILANLDDDDWSRLFGEVDGESRGFMLAHIGDEEIKLMVEGLDDASRARLFDNSEENPQMRRKILAALDGGGWSRLFEHVGGEGRGFMLAHTDDDVCKRMLRGVDDAARAEIFNESKWNPQLRCRMLAAIDENGWSRLFEHVSEESQAFMLAYIDDGEMTMVMGRLDDSTRIQIFNSLMENLQLRQRMLAALDGESKARLVARMDRSAGSFLVNLSSPAEQEALMAKCDDKLRGELRNQCENWAEMKWKLMALFHGLHHSKKKCVRPLNEHSWLVHSSFGHVHLYSTKYR